MIFVNFKTYEQGTGEKALQLAKVCQEVEKETAITIVPLVQAVDIFRLSTQGLEVWAQHVDDIDFGQNTGQVLPQAVVAAGAKGTLLNHSENKLPLEVIQSTIQKIRGVGTEKFKVLVCSESVEEAKQIAKVGPDLIAYEPPEFIGSQTISVATARPEVIKDFLKEIKGVPILVGAGIHSRDDVKAALGLGAVGVLVATNVVLAKDPKKELLDLATAFQS